MILKALGRVLNSAEIQFPPPPLLVPIRTALRGSGVLRRDVDEVEDLEGGFGLAVRLPTCGRMGHRRTGPSTRRGTSANRAVWRPSRPPRGKPSNYESRSGRLGPPALPVIR